MSVSGTTALEEFKAKHTTWIESHSGEDRHSVMQQIPTMIWDAAVYRVINEARTYAKEDDGSGVELNGMTHRLIDKCFFESQANAIRRLLDKNISIGKKSVFSLYRLIDDIKQNSHLLTRENFFIVEELPYDSTPVREAYYNYAKKQQQMGKRAWGIPSELNWRRIENRHREIDMLSGTDAEHRALNDTVRSELLAHLKEMLEECDEVVVHVNKFVAHASTPESRAAADIEEPSLTLGHLWRAHEVICKIAHFIDRYLLTCSSETFLAIPQFNQFKYIDRPLIASDKIVNLREVWKQYEEETRTWRRWGLHELISEM